MPDLNTILGQRRGGTVERFSDEAMMRYLRDNYLSNDGENVRQEDAKNRLDLLYGRGHDQIRALIDRVFNNATVKKWRKEWVGVAAFQNISQRIINEISRVYAEPATRKINRGPEIYDRFISEVRQDERMRQVNRLVNYLNEVFLWFDVDAFTNEPRLHIETPDRFWAVSHPEDRLLHIATIIRQFPQTQKPAHEQPHYLCMYDGGFFYIDGNKNLMSETVAETGIEGMPGFLVHRQLPTERLLDPYGGGDLVAAHKSLWFLMVMFMKHQKAGAKQAYIAGDTAATPTDQPMDEEVLLTLQEGSTISVVDLGSDPSNYIDAARFVIKNIASNYGIPESVFDQSYQASSGFEIELKRTALRENRLEQIMQYRPVERKLAEIQSRVLTQAGHELRFSTDGWRIDFGEVEAPSDPMQRLSHFEKRRQLGLTNTLEMIMLENPEFTVDDALRHLLSNIEVESVRVQEMRALNMSFGSTSEDPGSDPEEQEEDDEEEEAEAA